LACSGPLQSGAFLRQAPTGIGPVAAPLSAPIPWPCFLLRLLRSAGLSHRRCVLQTRRGSVSAARIKPQGDRANPAAAAGLPLRRTWIEQPYGEEEITLLEEEVIPAIQQFLQRVDELDERLLAQQELLQRRQLEAEREALGALRLQMA
jgi:hypothetical protein